MDDFVPTSVCVSQEGKQAIHITFEKTLDGQKGRGNSATLGRAVMRTG